MPLRGFEILLRLYFIPDRFRLKIPEEIPEAVLGYIFSFYLSLTFLLATRRQLNNSPV